MVTKSTYILVNAFIALFQLWQHDLPAVSSSTISQDSENPSPVHPIGEQNGFDTTELEKLYRHIVLILMDLWRSRRAWNKLVNKTGRFKYCTIKVSRHPSPITVLAGQLHCNYDRTTIVAHQIGSGHMIWWPRLSTPQTDELQWNRPFDRWGPSTKLFVIGWSSTQERRRRQCSI